MQSYTGRGAAPSASFQDRPWYAGVLVPIRTVAYLILS